MTRDFNTLARVTAMAAAAALLTACASGPKSVLDITWGSGWSRGSADIYEDDDPMREKHLQYYIDQVTTHDAAGMPLAPVDQVQFQEDLPSNAETGQSADEAAFFDAEGNRVSIEDYKGNKHLVLVFTRGYPGYVCPLCTSYTAQITHRYAELAAADAEVLLVFPGSPKKVNDFVRACREIVELEGEGALPFPVLLDANLKNVEMFGIQGDLARPSTYVIDKAGTVRYAFVGDQPHERPDVDTILRELQRLEPTGP